MKKLGICIIAWNRPKYLRETIESLKENDLKDTEIHLFQDGYECAFTGTRVAEPDDITESVLTFKEIFPKGEVHKRKENVSIAINQYEALRFMTKEYESFLFIEEDVHLSPHYVELMRMLDEQFKGDERVSNISPSFRLYCKKGEEKENEDRLMFSNGHTWAELYWSDKLKTILDIYLSYYSLVKYAPYKARNHTQIRQLFEDSGFSYAGVTSQDMGKDWATFMSGMKRARMVVNRATGIGDVGFHSTPEKLKKLMDGHNPIYTSDTELNIKEFKL